MKVALYLRVSTDLQTIENQRLVLTQVAAARGWTITHEFADEGISGLKGRDERPGLDALHICIRQRECDMVAAWSLDRLGRSVIDQQLLLQDIKKAGVELYMHQQQFDATTDDGEMMFTIVGAIAKREARLIAARTKAGLERARAAGKRIGRPATIPADLRVHVAQLRGQMSVRRAAAVTGVSKTHVHEIWGAA